MVEDTRSCKHNFALFVNKTLRIGGNSARFAPLSFEKTEKLQPKVAKSNIFLLQSAKNGCMMLQCATAHIYCVYFIKSYRRTL